MPFRWLATRVQACSSRTSSNNSRSTRSLLKWTWKETTRWTKFAIRGQWELSSQALSACMATTIRTVLPTKWLSMELRGKHWANMLIQTRRARWRVTMVWIDQGLVVLNQSRSKETSLSKILIVQQREDLLLQGIHHVLVAPSQRNQGWEVLHPDNRTNSILLKHYHNHWTTHNRRSNHRALRRQTWTHQSNLVLVSLIQNQWCLSCTCGAILLRNRSGNSDISAQGGGYLSRIIWQDINEANFQV